MQRFYIPPGIRLLKHTCIHTVLTIEELRDDVSQEPFFMKLPEDKLPLTKR